MAEIGEAGAGYQADIARADHRDAQGLIPQIAPATIVLVPNMQGKQPRGTVTEATTPA
jgi:hypothetical protein